MPNANDPAMDASAAAKKTTPTKAAKKKAAAKKAATKKTGTKKAGTKKAGSAGASSAKSKRRPADDADASQAQRTSASDPADSQQKSNPGGFPNFEGFGADGAPWGMPFGFGNQAPDFTEVGEFIRNQREVAKLSVRRLAELANVSNPYLSQVERGLRKPSADILQQLANALRISVESLYVRAGILPEDPDRVVSSVPEAIEHDPDLSDEQKVALRGVYDSFVNPPR